ncbi:MAG: HNH endonuclease [Anaerolineae bacterium]
MPLLYYWRGDNYRHDLDYGAGYHLNQANPLMHTIDSGDSLWAFTRTRKGFYTLAAELVVRAKTFNPPNFRYGRYRIWGDLHKSRYFKADQGPRVDAIIRSLSCRANAPYLGQSFQGAAAVRRITAADHQILCAFAAHLPLEPRAQILPEEKLEATLLLGDYQKVESLVRQEAHGIAEQRQEYLYTQAPTRNRQFVQELQERYAGRCQICGWDPNAVYDEKLCHGHHLQWLSRGGEDALSNLVLICPNHHAAVHQCDAPFDFFDGTFVFSDHREPLQINSHLALT